MALLGGQWILRGRTLGEVSRSLCRGSQGLGSAEEEKEYVEMKMTIVHHNKASTDGCSAVVLKGV